MFTALSPKAAGNAPQDIFQVNPAKSSAVGTVKWIVAGEETTAVFIHILHPLYQLDAGLVRVPGYHQIAGGRRPLTVGAGVNQHLVTRLEQGQHGIARYPKAPPPPEQPAQQFGRIAFWQGGH